jgi:hypothetical protein
VVTASGSASGAEKDASHQVCAPASPQQRPALPSTSGPGSVRYVAPARIDRSRRALERHDDTVTGRELDAGLDAGMEELVLHQLLPTTR